MRRNRRGSPARPAARFVRPAIPSALSVALLVCTPGLATADPQTDTIAALIADVAKANQRLQDLSDEVQAEQESVNKAMVDVETARDNAAAAEDDLEVSQRAVKDANAAIAAAQHRFDTFAAATYMNGPSVSYLSASSPDEIIATVTAAKTLSASSQAVMANLQRARTERVNTESAARLAKQKADKAAADAKASQDAAVARSPRPGGSSMNSARRSNAWPPSAMRLKPDCRRPGWLPGPRRVVRVRRRSGCGIPDRALPVGVHGMACGTPRCP